MCINRQTWHCLRAMESYSTVKRNEWLIHPTMYLIFNIIYHKRKEPWGKRHDSIYMKFCKIQLFRKQISYCLEMWAGEGWIIKGHRKLLWVTNMFIILIIVMALWIYMHVSKLTKLYTSCIVYYVKYKPLNL